MDFDTYNGIRVIADEVATRLTIKFGFLIGILILIIIILFFILYNSRNKSDLPKNISYPDPSFYSQYRPNSYEIRPIPVNNNYSQAYSRSNYNQNSYNPPYFNENNSQNQNNQNYF